MQKHFAFIVRLTRQPMPYSTGSMQAVRDATGREDLTDALRKQLLLSRAADLGCNKVAMGDSATRVAVRVVSGTVKGQGFALPGDIQSADARCAFIPPSFCPCGVNDQRHRDLCSEQASSFLARLGYLHGVVIIVLAADL